MGGVRASLPACLCVRAGAAARVAPRREEGWTVAGVWRDEPPSRCYKPLSRRDEALSRATPRVALARAAQLGINRSSSDKFVPEETFKVAYRKVRARARPHARVRACIGCLSGRAYLRVRARARAARVAEAAYRGMHVCSRARLVGLLTEVLIYACGEIWQVCVFTRAS